MNINKNYLNLKDSYLFSTIAKKVGGYKAANLGKEIHRLGIGDVTLPLAPAVTEAMQRAVTEMGDIATFRGYGEEQGYDFLRQAICGYYAKKGVSVSGDEVFVSDGAKSDLGNILDIFGVDNTVLIPDPVYPVYVDTNIMVGRKIVYLDGNAENGFLPLPTAELPAEVLPQEGFPKEVLPQGSEPPAPSQPSPQPPPVPDIIYLCSPNNPTGAVYNKEQLALWVDYALRHNAVILFDSAYECFVQDKSLPTSIYQIDGAYKCAIEFCSLSKTAGFTGTRCGYTVIPHALIQSGIALNKLWLRRQTTKTNGVSYIVQRGAEAVFTENGALQVENSIAYYMQNAKIIADTLTELGIWFTGGINSPYIWLKCPNGMTSWEYFDYLLETAGIVGTPGAGFGANGEGFFRLSAFGSNTDTSEAMKKLTALHSVGQS